MSDPEAIPRSIERAGVRLLVLPSHASLARSLDLPSRSAADALLSPDANAGAGGLGRTHTHLLETPDGPTLHVRRALHGGWLGPLWRGHLAGLGRLGHELTVTAQLERAGAPVPRPAFAVGVRSGPLWKAVLCTEHIPGALDLIRWLQTKPDADALHDGAEVAGRAVRCTHDHGLHHADLHLGNILLALDRAEARAWVIDLDRARIQTAGGDPAHAAELARFERSLAKHMPVAELAEAFRTGFRAGYEASV